MVKWFNNWIVNSMFDELKEVNYFKEIADLKGLIMWNTLKK